MDWMSPATYPSYPSTDRRWPRGCDPVPYRSFCRSGTWARLLSSWYWAIRITRVPVIITETQTTMASTWSRCRCSKATPSAPRRRSTMLDLPDQWVWDFWVTRAQGTFHGFFLKAPRALEDPERRHRSASVGHAASADLIIWSFLPDAVAPQSQPAFDDMAVWTGCVVADPAGGWRMFTTGISVADHGLE